MGTVHKLAAAGGTVTLGQAVTAYLATLAGAEQTGTRTVYGRILRRLERDHGPGMTPGELEAEASAAWFTGQWNDRAPATWNGALDAFRSAVAYWADQGWITEDPDPAAAPTPPEAGPQPRPVPHRSRATAHPRRRTPARARAVAHALQDRREVGRGAPPRRCRPGHAQP
jgi:hypothetical protein